MFHIPRPTMARKASVDAAESVRTSAWFHKTLLHKKVSAIR